VDGRGGFALLFYARGCVGRRGRWRAAQAPRRPCRPYPPSRTRSGRAATARRRVGRPATLVSGHFPLPPPFLPSGAFLGPADVRWARPETSPRRASPRAPPPTAGAAAHRCTGSTRPPRSPRGRAGSPTAPRPPRRRSIDKRVPLGQRDMQRRLAARARHAGQALRTTGGHAGGPAAATESRQVQPSKSPKKKKNAGTTLCACVIAGRVAQGGSACWACHLPTHPSPPSMAPCWGAGPLPTPCAAAGAPTRRPAATTLADPSSPTPPPPPL